MSKVVLIGIDALDSILLSRFEDDLPNFRELKRQTPEINLTSIFPPDSVPAWVSIYTGISPARHGVINFVNPADRKGKLFLTEVDNSHFQGKTLWDVASAYGKKVCIVLPYAVYPAYSVNGAMVCRITKAVPRNFPLDIFPQSLAQKYQYSSAELNLFSGFVPQRKLPGFIQDCRERTYAEAELALKMLRGEEWDLFHVYFSAIDAIQHSLWRYFDENDPTYPGDSSYRNEIRDFYILCDQIIGQFRASVSPDTVVMVVSDHGLGQRPTRLLSLNEILRRKGFLVRNQSWQASRINPLRYPQHLKSMAAKLVSKYGLGQTQLKLLQRFTFWKRIFASPVDIDWKSTIAYVCDISAIKAYSYGGIIINRDIVSNDEYEPMRKRLIAELSEIEDPDSKQNIMNWICRREELYSGEYLPKYPDILFELKEGYGIGWTLGNLIEKSPMHAIHSGSHTLYSPVCLFSNIEGKECVKSNVTLMDIAPTILELLGIPAPDDIDGNTLLIDISRDKKKHDTR